MFFNLSDLAYSFRNEVHERSVSCALSDNLFLWRAILQLTILAQIGNQFVNMSVGVHHIDRQQTLHHEFFVLLLEHFLVFL